MNKTYDCMCTKLLVTVTHTLSWPGQQKLSSYNHYPMILGFLEGCLKCIGTRKDEGQKSLSFQFSSLLSSGRKPKHPWAMPRPSPSFKDGSLKTGSRKQEAGPGTLLVSPSEALFRRQQMHPTGL